MNTKDFEAQMDPFVLRCLHNCWDPDTRSLHMPNEISDLIAKSVNAEQVIRSILNSTKWESEQFYGELSIRRGDDEHRARLDDYLERTASAMARVSADAGSVAVVSMDGGSMTQIGNGYGDGDFTVAVVNLITFNQFMARNTGVCLHGKFRVLPYDCGFGLESDDDECLLLDGGYIVYNFYGTVIFAKFE